MKYSVFTFDSRGSIPLVGDSLALFGVRCTVLGQGVGQWQNTCKIELALKALSNDDSDYVIVCDGYDVLFLAHPREVIDRFLAFQCALVLNADKRLWPRSTKQDRDFGEMYRQLSDSPFRYLNSGCYVGHRRFLIDFLSKALTAPRHPKFVGSDQYLLHHAFHAARSGDVRLDSRCEIFQVLNRVKSSEVERQGVAGIYNQIFGTRPVVLHANRVGRTNIFEEIRSGILPTAGPP